VPKYAFIAEIIPGHMGKSVFSLCLALLLAVAAVFWTWYAVIGGTLVQTWRGLVDLHSMIVVSLGFLSWHFFATSLKRFRSTRQAKEPVPQDGRPVANHPD
jgi:hypothetical protein